MQISVLVAQTYHPHTMYKHSFPPFERNIVFSAFQLYYYVTVIYLDKMPVLTMLGRFIPVKLSIGK